MSERTRRGFTLSQKSFDIVEKLQKREQKRDRNDALEAIILAFDKYSEETPVAKHFSAILEAMTLISNTLIKLEDRIETTLTKLGTTFEATVVESARKNPELTAIRRSLQQLEEIVRGMEREARVVIREAPISVPKIDTKKVPEGKLVGDEKLISDLGL